MMKFGLDIRQQKRLKRLKSNTVIIRFIRSKLETRKTDIQF